MASLQRLVADNLLTKGQTFQQGQILDIGSGTGYVSAHLAERQMVTKVTGLDIAQGMLNSALLTVNLIGS